MAGRSVGVAARSGAMTCRCDRCGLAWPGSGQRCSRLAMLAATPAARADDAAAWLARAAAAARQQNYVGTIVYQHGGHVETSRLVHLNEHGERIREARQPRRPGARGDPQQRRGPLLLPRRQGRPRRAAHVSQRLSVAVRRSSRRRWPSYYDFRKAERGRVAGLETQAWVFEPKDGLRYGHKFWADPVSGLLVKARIFDERNEVVEQFAFTEISIGAQDRSRDGQADLGGGAARLARAPVGAGRRRSEGDRLDGHPRCRRASSRSSMASGGCAGSSEVAHLVYSDGLVAVSVFIEPVGSAPHPIGHVAPGRHQRRTSGSRTTIS